MSAAGRDGWATVLRVRHARRLLIGTTVGRLPAGMAPLVVVLAARAEGGSLAWGSLLAAVFCCSLAVGHPLLGRLSDAIGQTLPMVVGALCAALACVTLALPGVVLSPFGVLLTAAAGLSTPPMEATTRALWRTLVPARRLATAYSVDNAVGELSHVAAPLLVTGCVALHGPRFALLVMAVVGVVGAVSVALCPPSRQWRPSERAGGMLGALRPPSMRVLQLLLVLVGITIGGTYVGATVAAERLGASWLAGVMPAALSVGCIAGCALYSLSRWRTPVSRQLPLLCAMFALAWLPLTTAAGTPATYTLATAGAGLLFGPVLVTSVQAIDLLAPAASRTEAQAWLTASVGIGMAAGSALAGRTDGPIGTVSLAAALILALLSTTVHRPLRRAESTPALSLVVLRGGAGTTAPHRPGPAAPVADLRRGEER